jgi:hypothetical protein
MPAGAELSVNTIRRWKSPALKIITATAAVTAISLQTSFLNAP